MPTICTGESRATAKLAGGSLTTYLYWTSNAGSVFRSHADGSFLEQMDLSRTLRRITYDPNNDWLYYSEEFSKNILIRRKADGSERQILRTLSTSADDIQLDLLNGKIYLLENNPKVISRMNLDGTAYETVLTPIGDAQFLALDPPANRLYYSTTGTVHWARLDGSDHVLLLNVSNLNDIAVDSPGQKLYNCIRGEGVDRCDANGSSCQRIMNNSCRSIQIAGSAIYVAQFSSDLLVADLDGSNTQSVTLPFMTSTDFVIDGLMDRLFTVAARDLLRINLDGTGLVTLETFVAEGLHGIAVDGQNEALYVTANGHPTPLGSSIRSVDLGSLGNNFSREDAIRGLALEPVTSTLFFAEASGPRRIQSRGTSGAGLTTLLSAISSPHDVEVDAGAGKIYWTEGVESGDTPTLTIFRANLDGSGQETLIAGLSSSIRGLSLDTTNGKMYWGNRATDEIWWADLDGTGSMMITSATDVHDIVADPVAGRIYWSGDTDSSGTGGTVGSANLDGSMPSTLHSGLPRQIRDITLTQHDNLGIFEDGFESGNVTSWSFSTP